MNMPVTAMLWLASGRARLRSCRRLSDSVRAGARCPFRRACADVRLDDGGG